VLRPGPFLGLLQQCAELAEQVGRKRVLALQRLDALQAGEESPRFLHAPTLAGPASRVCDWPVARASTRARAGREIAGRPGPQAEQRLVEGSAQARPVVVLERLDDRAAHVVGDLDAAGLAARKEAQAVD
jgi:hypothetical protein